MANILIEVASPNRRKFSFFVNTPHGVAVIDVDQPSFKQSLLTVLPAWTRDSILYVERRSSADAAGETVGLGRGLSILTDLLHQALQSPYCSMNPEWEARVKQNLDTILSIRFLLFGVPECLDELIDMRRKALGSASADPYCSINEFIQFLQLRRKKQPSTTDLDEIITLHRQAMSLPNVTAENYMKSLSALTESLWQRFIRDGGPCDILEVIQLTRKHLSLTAFHDTHCVRTSSMLANSLVAHFRVSPTKDVGDLGEAIKYHQRVLHLTPQHLEAQLKTYDSLAETLVLRYKERRLVEDIRAATQSRRRALLLTSDPPSHHEQLSNLALELITLSEEVDDFDAADEALTLYRRLLVEGIPTSDTREDMKDISGLAAALRKRGTLRRDLHNVKESVDILEKQLLLCPEKHPDHASLLQNLSLSLLALFGLTGHTADLNQAIINLRLAVQSYPLDHPYRWSHSSLLANMLCTRFEINRDPHDLDEAVGLLEITERLSQKNDHRRASILMQFAIVKFVQFEYTHLLDNLNHSIRHYTEASEICAPSDRWLVLNHLAGALRNRFQISHPLQSVDDLNQAMSLHTECLGLCQSSDRAQSYRCMNNYAISLRVRDEYESTRQPSDLDDAIETFDKAAALLFIGHPARAKVLSNNAAALYRRFRRKNRILGKDLECLMGLLSQALNDNGSSIHDRLDIGFQWVETLTRDLYSSTNTTPETSPDLAILKSHLLDIFEHTLTLLPQLAFLGSDIKSRVDNLYQVPSLACDAMAHAISMGEIERAISLLERGRSVFWSQALQLRGPFDLLPSSLAEKLKTAAKDVETGSHNFRMYPGDPQAILREEQQAFHQRKLVEKYNTLLEEACKDFPTFKAALKLRTYRELAAVASEGPVVVLNASRLRCDAVVIRSPESTPEVVNLPGVDIRGLKRQLRIHRVVTKQARNEEPEELLERAGSGSRPPRGADGSSVLRYLWVNVMYPVIKRLQLPKLLPNTDKQNRPRLWLCPAGLFVHFPLHAAGDYTNVTECLSDYVIPSYSPTLESLIRARELYHPGLSRNYRFLAIGQPQGATLHYLSNVKKEINLLQELVPSENTIHLGDSPSLDDSTVITNVDNVIPKIPYASILHFACHGIQDRSNPLSSGFQLLDKRLTVADFMKLDMQHALLAYLSACQTFTSDEVLQDENINLASAMLFVGFRSVVGTMWNIGDVDGPYVAKDVYKSILTGDMVRLDLVPEALDGAVRRLRETDSRIAAWAPYVHVGM